MMLIKSITYFFVLVAGLLMPFATNNCTLPSAAETTHVGCTSYPQNYFSSPLDIPLQLAGTFGELRSNHFHTGIDCKTGGQQKLPIYAVAEGFVSRINISPWGYGNALYIDHPNGYTSVYAHLRTLEGNIGRYISSQQYQAQSFAIDIKVPAGLLYVDKGEVIALSGNSGSSQGPHLHFEMRNTYTEEAINPLLFGYEVVDDVPPLVEQVALYTFDQPANFEHKKLRTLNAKSKGKGIYAINNPMQKVSTPYIGVGIKAYDKMTGLYHLNGIYSLQMYDNGQLMYSFDMEKIDFDESRYINSHIDFHNKKSGGGSMQKCFIEPGNHLSIYKNVLNKGRLNISDGKLHKINFDITDADGNKSTISFMLQYAPTTEPAKAQKQSIYTTKFFYNTDNYYNTDYLKLYMPYGCLYNDLPFVYEEKTHTASSSASNIYSNYHQIHTGKIPVHDYYEVGIKPKRNIPSELMDKAVIVYKNVAGRVKTVNSQWYGAFLKGEAKEFGTFYIATDTQAPTIKPLNIYNGKNMQKNSFMSFQVKDNLSGIATYDAYVDGQWVLMQYDAKYAKLKYYFDEYVGTGSHELRLVVTDGVGNEKVYEANFIR